MTGIIFAAGIGSRLKPFTDHHPKALAEVGGVPNVVNVARKLLAAGADSLIVNLHHFPAQIRDCLVATEFADKVVYSDESELLLDTGGALAKIAREGLVELADDECVMVHNADIYTDFPIEEMLAAHKADGADATILVDPRRESTRHFLFGADGLLRGWENVSKGVTKPADLRREGLLAAAFGGVHVISGRFMRELGSAEAGVPFSITDTYIEDCGRLKIKGYTPSAPYRWHDIGTPEKLAAANADVRAGF